MNQHRTSLTIRLCSSLLLSGCTGATTAPHAHSAEPAFGDQVRPSPDSTNQGSLARPSGPAANTIEPRITRMVERAMATTDDPLLPNRARLAVVQHQLQRAGANSSELPQIKAPASAATSAHEVASNRFETLRVLSRSGGACAAVSIASRLAVTALHCVRSLCESMHRSDASLPIDCGIEYENPDGFNGLTRVVAESENDLLALLELERPQSKYGALCCDDPRAEDRVYTVSHPAGVNWLMSYGRLTREPIPLEWVEGQATRVLVAEIPTKPGSSGGGLFDFEDRVVGIQIARWSPWTRDSSKAAFIQANRIFNFAGNYCIKRGSSACKGLRCVSRSLDVWRFN